jgi:hypothetical protein
VRTTFFADSDPVKVVHSTFITPATPSARHRAGHQGRRRLTRLAALATSAATRSPIVFAQQRTLFRRNTAPPSGTCATQLQWFQDRSEFSTCGLAGTSVHANLRRWPRSHCSPAKS